MWPKPDQPDVVHRMRAAHTRACTALGVQPRCDAEDTWGWHGRTLGRPVTNADGSRWLRLASAPIDDIVETFWNGATEAQRHIPRCVPRPQLIGCHDWDTGRWAYRAELYEHVPGRVLANAAILTAALDLPSTWWRGLRTALDDIAAVPTLRRTIHPGYVARIMLHHLGLPAEDGAGKRPWTTAHGDLHYANLIGPELHLLDWEGWGAAPAGYDAATLHSYSLLVPAAATRVRRELAHILNTPAGRYAELAVISEILDSTTQGENLELAEPVRRRAALLLGRSPKYSAPPASSESARKQSH